MGARLNGLDRTRIAAEAARCERTVRRVYDGGGSPYARESVRRAAERLGYPPPPDPSQPPAQR